MTRDRKEVDVEWNGSASALVDTGGIDIEGPGIAKRGGGAGALSRVAEADLVLFVVDTQIGDRAGRPGGRGDPAAGQGADDRRGQQGRGVRRARRSSRSSSTRSGSAIRSRSRAIHGTNSGDLLDLIVERLAEIPGAARDEGVTDEIGVAILGRPNVGKSSLAQRARRRAARDRLGGAGHDPRLDRHAAGARGHDVTG